MSKKPIWNKFTNNKKVECGDYLVILKDGKIAEAMTTGGHNFQYYVRIGTGGRMDITNQVDYYMEGYLCRQMIDDNGKGEEYYT